MARGSHAAAPAQPSVLVRVQGGSRLAFGVTTAALVTVASGATAVLVSQGTTSPPGASALAPNAPVTDGGVVQDPVVVDRAAGAVAPRRRTPARPAAPVLPGTGVLLASFSPAVPTGPASVTSVLLLGRPAAAVQVPSQVPTSLPSAVPTNAPAAASVATVRAPAVALQRVLPSSTAERAATAHHERQQDPRPADAGGRGHGKPAGSRAAHPRHAKQTGRAGTGRVKAPKHAR